LVLGISDAEKSAPYKPVQQRK